MANNGPTAATSAQLARASEPICQNTSDCSSLSLAIYVRKPINAEQNAAIAIPTSSSVALPEPLPGRANA